MSDKIDLSGIERITDNPSAFACCAVHPAGDEIGQEGMSLRDYYAGQVMQALIGKDMFDCNLISGVGFNVIAENAFIMADTMLRVREVKS